MPETFDLREQFLLDRNTLGAILRAAKHGPVRIHVLLHSRPAAKLLAMMGGSRSTVFRGLGFPDFREPAHYVYELDLSRKTDASAPAPAALDGRTGARGCDPDGPAPRRGALCADCPFLADSGVPPRA